MHINPSQNVPFKNEQLALSKPDTQKENTSALKDTFNSSQSDASRSMKEMLSELKEKALAIMAKSTYFPVLVAKKEVDENRAEKLLNMLQPGDLILETTQNRPFMKVAEKLAGDSDYTHVAIYEGNGQMIEANVDHKSGFGVDRKDVEKEFNMDMMQFKIVRPPYQSQEDIDSALNYARDQIGKPYDALLSYEGDSRMYCSELIAKSLAQMPNKIDVPVRTVLGKSIAMPQDAENIKGAKVLYDEKASFWEGQLRTLPSLAGGVVLAGSVALSLGPVVGAVGALVGGTVITSLVGGAIQEKFEYDPLGALGILDNFDNFDNFGIDYPMQPY